MPVDLFAIRELLDNVRPIVAPIRTTSVTVRTKTWPGLRGVGTPTIANLTLPAYVKVRELSDREIATSGGKRELGDVKVTSITPEYPGGGLSLAQIAPDAGSEQVEVIYVLAGAISGEYRRIAVHADRPFRYELVLRRLNTTP